MVGGLSQGVMQTGFLIESPQGFSVDGLLAGGQQSQVNSPLADSWKPDADQSCRLGVEEPGTRGAKGVFIKSATNQQQRRIRSSCTPSPPVAQNSSDNSGTSLSEFFLLTRSNWQQLPPGPMLILRLDAETPHEANFKPRSSRSRALTRLVCPFHPIIQGF